MPDMLVLTVLVDRPDAERVTSNAADGGIDSIPYDLVIRNHGTIDQLQKAAVLFSTLLLGSDQSSDQGATVEPVDPCLCLFHDPADQLGTRWNVADQALDLPGVDKPSLKIAGL